MDKDQEKSSKTVIGRVISIVGIIIDTFEAGSLIACMGALTILLNADVIAREFFRSIYFTDEISKFLVIFTTFVGLSYGVRRARHIRMGAFMDMMNPRWEKAFIIIISISSSAVMFVMGYASYKYLVHSMRLGHMTPALRLPFWLFYLIMPIGFFMAGIQYIRTIIKNVTEKEVWMSPERQSEYGEV